jgi:hypothetical protein
MNNNLSRQKGRVFIIRIVLLVAKLLLRISIALKCWQITPVKGWFRNSTIATLGVSLTGHLAEAHGMSSCIP